MISLLVGWCKRSFGDLSEFKKNPEKAAAEMMIRMSPDLQKVSQDDAKGEMTIRTKDGKELTMSYKDISKGKFSMRDSAGNVAEFGGTDLSKLPAWVPQVPNITGTSASVMNSANGKVSGFYALTSSDSIDSVDEFFKIEGAKLNATESSRTTFNADGIESRTISYSGSDRKLNIVLTGKPGEEVQVNVGYEEGK